MPRKGTSLSQPEQPHVRRSRESAGLSGEIISATITGVEPTGTDLKSSCADLIRASTSLFRALEGVDGRDKPGQNEIAGRLALLCGRRIFPVSPALSRE